MTNSHAFNDFLKSGRFQAFRHQLRFLESSLSILRTPAGMSRPPNMDDQKDVAIYWEMLKEDGCNYFPTMVRCQICLADEVLDGKQRKYTCYSCGTEVIIKVRQSDHAIMLISDDGANIFGPEWE